MTTAPCPACHSDVIIDDEVYEHDMFTCANCGRDCEVISVTPVELATIADDSAEEQSIS